MKNGFLESVARTTIPSMKVEMHLLPNFNVFLGWYSNSEVDSYCCYISCVLAHFEDGVISLA